MSEPAGRKVTKLLSAKLPHDDTGATLMRFDDIRGQRYTEIFLIGGHAIIHDINAGIYNTIGLNDPGETGDTTPPGDARPGRCGRAHPAVRRSRRVQERPAAVVP